MNTFSYIRNENVFRKLGIVSWKLRYPVVLNNTMAVQLYIRLRLLLISDSFISLYDPLINDVLRAMCISLQDVCVLTENQINNLILPTGFLCHCWWVGISSELRDFHGVCLHTPSLSVLKCDIEAKRDLWNQIKQIIHLFNK